MNLTHNEPVERFPWVEVFRGLAILEVVLHHVTGRFLRELSPGSPEWLLLAGVNRTLHFAVPAFLFMTALVLGASFHREFRLGRYLKSRALRLLWPYLLWSGIYLLFRYWDTGVFQPERLLHQLLFGKAYFHLYFLVVALELALLLPLFRPILLRRPHGVWFLLLGAGGTLALYFLNRAYRFLPYPGSFVLWYLPAIALGLYLASRLEALPRLLRYWPLGLLAAGLGLWGYLPLALDVLQRVPVNTFHYQAFHWIFTTGMAFLLLALAHALARTPLRGPLAFLGRYSLQIYLVHPMVMRLLEKYPGFPEPLGLKPAFAVYLALALLLPLLLARLLARARVSPVVFGR
ncbi:acyltransferase 3 [Thermus thermophilus]|uniref:Acyltransferase n=1 Tax=Thermus thermophilus TaxID=274 RepID=A0A1J1ETY7_THETH|nr:acyltransferase 3 [Thermus thermophilus]BCP66887.1 acyltransferase [Thermus thermophilus]BDB12303.1 acyltransferase [Thermus thermophilus]